MTKTRPSAETTRFTDLHHRRVSEFHGGETNARHRDVCGTRAEGCIFKHVHINILYVLR